MIGVPLWIAVFLVSKKDMVFRVMAVLKKEGEYGEKDAAVLEQKVDDSGSTVELTYQEEMFRTNFSFFFLGYKPRRWAV